MKSKPLLIFPLLAFVALSACSPPLRESLPADLAGRDLHGRMQVLNSTCAEHARRHFGRKDSATSHLRLADICRQLGGTIIEASQSKQTQNLRPVISGLLSKCYVEGRNVRYNDTPSGVTQKGSSHNKALLQQESQIICDEYKREFTRLNTARLLPARNLR